MRTPIEIMIDEACEEKESVEDIAQRISQEVIGHIDLMYPLMWKNVPKTARVSVRNTIINEIRFRFKGR